MRKFLEKSPPASSESLSRPRGVIRKFAVVTAIRESRPAGVAKSSRRKSSKKSAQFSEEVVEEVAVQGESSSGGGKELAEEVVAEGGAVRGGSREEVAVVPGEVATGVVGVVVEAARGNPKIRDNDGL